MDIALSDSVLNAIKWDVFWDFPLYVDDKPLLTYASSIHAAVLFANHPGMLRNSDEIRRSTTSYQVTECKVSTNEARLEVTYSGVEIGIFSSYLQFDIFIGVI